MTAAPDRHVAAYAKHLGYNMENHPDWATVTWLLERKAEARAAFQKSLEAFLPTSTTGEPKR